MKYEAEYLEDQGKKLHWWRSLKIKPEKAITEGLGKKHVA